MENEKLSDTQQSAGRSRGLGMGVVAGIGLGAFALGAGLAAVIAWQGGGAPIADPSLINEAVKAPIADLSPLAGRAGSANGAAPAQSSGLDEREVDKRVAALEKRLNRIDLQAAAASGNAARAEGLLIAFAARRAIERGAPLGYLADQLRLRFGDARPNAVRTIIEASRDPVTLDQLAARLEGLSANIMRAPKDEAMIARVRRELDSLFVIRRETSPSPAPARRLERARMFLQTGRVDAAAAEVRNLPGAEEARAWIIDAERYAAAQEALNLIETAAVLDPRELRDSAGNRVEQLSPIIGG